MSKYPWCLKLELKIQKSPHRKTLGEYEIRAQHCSFWIQSKGLGFASPQPRQILSLGPIFKLHVGKIDFTTLTVEVFSQPFPMTLATLHRVEHFTAVCHACRTLHPVAKKQSGPQIFWSSWLEYSSLLYTGHNASLREKKKKKKLRVFFKNKHPPCKCDL